MKRLILLILLACLYTPIVAGQSMIVSSVFDIDKYRVIDTTKIVVTYNLSRVNDADNPDNSTHQDIQALTIGNTVSKYYSRYLLEYAAYRCRLIKDGARSAPNNNMPGAVPYEIYKNHPNQGVMTVTDVSNLFKDTQYVYEESIPSFSWMLHDEFSDILGYRCQKASTSFRGRNYTAWFTMEIPISNGPWKFGGLPGLIMKVTDSENHYDFECIGIEQPKEIMTIKLYDLKYTTIKRMELEKLYKRMHNDYAVFLTSQGIITRTLGADERPITVSSLPAMPYNPIERK